MSFITLIFVGIGGFLGAISRYAVFHVFRNIYHRGIPIGTLSVNFAGSFLIGVCFALMTEKVFFERHTMPHFFFITGFLGAFTTFSTFSQDNLGLLLQKNYEGFLLNISLNVFLSLLAVFLAFYLTKKLI